jgi:hypothetical protein
MARLTAGNIDVLADQDAAVLTAGNLDVLVGEDAAVLTAGLIMVLVDDEAGGGPVPGIQGYGIGGRQIQGVPIANQPAQLQGKPYRSR